MSVDVGHSKVEPPPQGEDLEFRLGTQNECSKEGCVSEADSPLSRSGESCILMFSALNLHNEWKERWAPMRVAKKES